MADESGALFYLFNGPPGRGRCGGNCSDRILANSGRRATPARALEKYRTASSIACRRTESQSRERDLSIYHRPGKRCDELRPRLTKRRVFRSGDSLSKRSARYRSSPDHAHGRARRIANPRVGGFNSKTAAIIRASLTPPNNAKV